MLFPFHANKLLKVGALANMQFTYSFPSGFTFLYLVQLDATSGDSAYEPGFPSRVDSWSQWSRWKRVCCPVYSLETHVLKELFVVGAFWR
jgi:hypothetical protein